MGKQEMNENCVTGKKGAFIVSHTEQVAVSLMATESRRTRGAATRGFAFCLARTSAIAAASHVTLKFSRSAPNFS